jgi:hypothetical protein
MQAGTAILLNLITAAGGIAVLLTAVYLSLREEPFDRRESDAAHGRPGHDSNWEPRA